MAEKELIERIISFIESHIYLSLALLISLHILSWKLLKSQPASLWKSETLKISELYIYPIKSLRGTKVPKAVGTKNGFEYDRMFMLLKVTADGYKTMAIAHYPEMARFVTSMVLPEEQGRHQGSITVEHVSPTGGKANTLEVPLLPDTAKLETFDISVQNSPTRALKMPAEYNAWFSQCFGYEVVLAYLGDNLRDVLFEDLKPTKSSSWLPKILGSQREGYQITFADCAPYLVVSNKSLQDVSSRLSGGQEMDMTKFRPNIVLQGAEKAWEEDYWGRISINGAELILAHNCVRCVSINVDYSTGQFGDGESGEILKRLQKDRRVDAGAKWSPVFGRYSYWNPKHGARVIKAGDDVFVTEINKERTTWSWEGLS